MAQARLVDLIIAQIPRRLRGRLNVKILSDPYYLRTEVVVTARDGIPYPSGPLETMLVGGKLVECKIPDWFIAHICSIPVDDTSLQAQLWDSLTYEDLPYVRAPMK